MWHFQFYLPENVGTFLGIKLLKCYGQGPKGETFLQYSTDPATEEKFSSGLGREIQVENKQGASLLLPYIKVKKVGYLPEHL